MKIRSSIAFKARINASKSRVWRTITDTRSWPLWGPSVLEVDSPERFIRAGLTGRIRTLFGAWLTFKIDAFEPERYWDWRICGISATGHKVIAIGPNHCFLSFTVPVWAFPYGIVCLMALFRIKRLIASSPR